LEALRDRAGSMLVTLPWHHDTEAPEPFADVRPIRERLLAWGFRETAIPADPARPSGLSGIEGALFRDDPNRRPRLDRADGLALPGAPRGEGEAREVASIVSDLLGSGTGAEEILVLVRHRGEASARCAETMRALGVPVAAGSAATLATEP